MKTNPLYMQLYDLMGMIIEQQEIVYSDYNKALDNKERTYISGIIVGLHSAVKILLNINSTKPDHYCPDFDYDLVHSEDPEMDFCLCSAESLRGL